ncbi:rhodanese-like domain-containing protein [Cytobacillus sp. FJAT-54145]|uniref:Rhodanese-like domain-containing protein n=1 Tax=Cytobacillus spartinae TaxID=3299023 RepID=A0ABW6K7Q4_9BACI
MLKKYGFLIIPLILVIIYIGYNSINNRGIEQITTSQLEEKMINPSEKQVFVDVREIEEYEAGHIEGMINIPLSKIETTLEYVQKDSEVILFCRSGNRSMQAAQALQDMGYKNIVNVEGGIQAWTGPLVK